MSETTAVDKEDKEDDNLRNVMEAVHARASDSHLAKIKEKEAAYEAERSKSMPALRSSAGKNHKPVTLPDASGRAAQIETSTGIVEACHEDGKESDLLKVVESRARAADLELKAVHREDHACAKVGSVPAGDNNTLPGLQRAENVPALPQPGAFSHVGLNGGIDDGRSLQFGESSHFLPPAPEENQEQGGEGDLDSKALGLAVANEVAEEDSGDLELQVAHESTREEEEFKKQQQNKKLCSRVLGLALVGIVCLLVVVLGLVFGLRKEEQVVFQTPSLAPSTSRELALMVALEGHLDTMFEPGSMYEKALNWLVFDDPKELDESSDNLIQRFILALFYFQTSQTNEWVSCNPPTTEDNTCEYLDFIRLPDNSIDYVPRRWPEIRWLSGTHECAWVNIDCDAERQVTEIDLSGQNLTGTMPDDLKHLKHLSWLTLSFNRFTGTIPEAYGEIKSLTAFECTDNLITGQIPSGFFQQPNLKKLNVMCLMLNSVVCFERLWQSI